LKLSCAHRGVPVRVRTRAVDNKANGFRHGTELFGHSPAKSPLGIARCWRLSRVASRGCHGYIPDEYIHALYPYPRRIRAGDAYSNCILRKRGKDICILSYKNCKIISDPYSRYKRQDTGIYKFIKLLGQTEFRYNAVHLSFPNPTIGRFICKHVAATSGNPARPGRNRSSTRLGPLAIPAKCDTSFRTVNLTTVYKNGGELPGPRPLGRTHQM